LASGKKKQDDWWEDCALSLWNELSFAHLKKDCRCAKRDYHKRKFFLNSTENPTDSSSFVGEETGQVLYELNYGIITNEKKNFSKKSFSKKWGIPHQHGKVGNPTKPQ